MIQRNNLLKALCLSLSIATSSGFADAPRLPAMENVLRNDFPPQPMALASLTASLFEEYERTGNVASLIFYSYGMLLQARYFLAVNDLINAAEYAKSGLFYLDEAVERNENDVRIRYLRARMDAYLPADLGRCVITIADTELLLKATWGRGITNNINLMRYRALHQCRKDKQARHFLAQMQGFDPAIKVNIATHVSPSWNGEEVSQIIVPLMKGD